MNVEIIQLLMLFEGYEYFILFLAGLASGSINTIAGGGSLLTLPILIFMGLPPTVANGTNRVQLIFSQFFAVYGFKSKGIFNYKLSLWLATSAVIGSLFGAKIAIELPEEFFKKILSVVMILVMINMIFKKNISQKEKLNQIKKQNLSIFLFFFIGMYGGFIHAGVGFLMILILSGVNGLDLVKANSIKVFVALLFTICAFGIFLLENKVQWMYGINLAIGSSIGGWITSRWSFNKSEKIMKYILCIIICFLAVRLWMF